jgi:hypothetical protein
MTESNKKPKVHEDPAIREVYANKVISTAFDGGAIVITLGVTRLVPDRVDTPPTPGCLPEVYVGGRLALSPPAAIELINGLQSMLAVIARPPQTLPTAMPAAGKAH